MQAVDFYQSIVESYPLAVLVSLVFALFFLTELIYFLFIKDEKKQRKQSWLMFSLGYKFTSFFLSSLLISIIIVLPLFIEWFIMGIIFMLPFVRDILITVGIIAMIILYFYINNKFAKKFSSEETKNEEKERIKKEKKKEKEEYNSKFNTGDKVICIKATPKTYADEDYDRDDTLMNLKKGKVSEVIGHTTTEDDHPAIRIEGHDGNNFYYDERRFKKK